MGSNYTEKEALLSAEVLRTGTLKQAAARSHAYTEAQGLLGAKVIAGMDIQSILTEGKSQVIYRPKTE